MHRESRSGSQQLICHRESHSERVGEGNSRVVEVKKEESDDRESEMNVNGT
jgi:hypothetical protein